MQVFPSPPEFPDFMAAFEGTILRIGLTNLLPNNGPTLSKACPESVNWSEFNSRLCGNDLFDLEGFCNPTTTAETTVASRTTPSLNTPSFTTPSLTTPQMAVVRSTSIIETTTIEITTKKSHDLGNNTTPSTVIGTSLYTVLNHLTDTDSTSAGSTSQPLGHTDSDDHGFKDHSAKNAESDYHTTKGIDSEDPVLPSDVFAVNGSKGVAEALYQGGGASIAIGVGCGMTLLCFVIIVVIIVISQPTR